MNGEQKTGQAAEPRPEPNELEALGQFLLSRDLDTATAIAVLSTAVGAFIGSNVKGTESQRQAMIDAVTVMQRSVWEFTEPENAPESGTLH